MIKRQGSGTLFVRTCYCALGALVSYSAYHFYKAFKRPPAYEPIEEIDRQPEYGIQDCLLGLYDEEVSFPEFVFGIARRRIQLASLARGYVLETSAGTNRNIDGYKYNKNISKIIFVDKNRGMLEIGCDKARNRILAGAPLPKMKFQVGDVMELEYEDDTFDTVVDTFGLCSCKDPLTALKEMRRCVKPEGRVLLLQHGLGSLSLLNCMLNKYSHEHARRWGCWWNRDISSLVKQAGLEILSERKYFLSTISFITARKPTADSVDIGYTSVAKDAMSTNHK